MAKKINVKKMAKNINVKNVKKYLNFFLFFAIFKGNWMFYKNDFKLGHDRPKAHVAFSPGGGIIKCLY